MTDRDLLSAVVGCLLGCLGHGWSEETSGLYTSMVRNGQGKGCVLQLIGDHIEVTPGRYILSYVGDLVTVMAPPLVIPLADPRFLLRLELSIREQTGR